MVTAPHSPEKLPAPSNPADYTLYTVKEKYYVKSKVHGSTEREISKREYTDLLETKTNIHNRLHKSIVALICVFLLVACNPPSKAYLTEQELNNFLIVNDSVIANRLTKLELQIQSTMRANDSIAWEFEHYRYWLWKEHNLTEHDYWKEYNCYGLCGPPKPNADMQRRTKLPSKDKNSIY